MTSYSDLRRFGTFRSADAGPSFDSFKLPPTMDLCNICRASVPIYRDAAALV